MEPGTSPMSNDTPNLDLDAIEYCVKRWEDGYIDMKAQSAMFKALPGVLSTLRTRPASPAPQGADTEDLATCIGCGKVGVVLRATPGIGPDAESDEECSECGSGEVFDTPEDAIRCLSDRIGMIDGAAGDMCLDFDSIGYAPEPWSEGGGLPERVKWAKSEILRLRAQVTAPSTPGAAQAPAPSLPLETVATALEDARQLAEDSLDASLENGLTASESVCRAKMQAYAHALTLVRSLRAQAHPSPPAPLLVWTREKPKKPGYYWIRLGKVAKEIALVNEMQYPSESALVVTRTEPFSSNNEHRRVSKYADEWEWSGPIPEPTEGKEGEG